jgi:DNA-binding GntR family transcriptional regulator
MNKESIYEHIKQQIIDEKLPSGHRFIERELTAAYRLSRTPIREILWKLTADGFLEQEANKGFIVRRLDLKEICEVYQAREAIEGLAARLACSNTDESFRSLLREIEKQLKEVDIEVDPGQERALARQLHNVILAACQNRIIVEIYERLNNLSVLTRNIAKKSPLIMKAAKEAHLMLISALLEQDGEKSEGIMREHVRNSCRYIMEHYYPDILSGHPNAAK